MSTAKPQLTPEQRLEKYLRDANDYWFHVYQPRPGDVIVDIGAGRGEDVYAFSRAVGPEGRVWAIEAHPESFEILVRFCRQYSLTNVTPLNLACMDKPGSLQIETLPVWESNFVREGEPSPSSHPVEAVTFDELCARYAIGRIDFLKMNIEGAERFALLGMTQAIRRIRHVSVCAHDFRAARGEGEDFRTHDLVVRTLENAGFTLVIRSTDPRYYVKEHIHGFVGRITDPPPDLPSG
jgi:FkbM family methyltransferase